MSTKNKFCQSCGIPMKQGGTNVDRSINENYRSYCYQNGDFTFNGIITEFQEFCHQKMIESGHYKFLSWLFTRGMKRLERWNKK